VLLNPEQHRSPKSPWSLERPRVLTQAVSLVARALEGTQGTMTLNSTSPYKLNDHLNPTYTPPVDTTISVAYSSLNITTAPTTDPDHTQTDQLVVTPQSVVPAEVLPGQLATSVATSAVDTLQRIEDYDI
jgi:hypothetical protein